MRFVVRSLVCLALICGLGACSEESLSPQEEIRQFIAAGVEAAEQRSVDELETMLHPAYLDSKGYRPQQIGRLLRGYFLRHKNIHLFTRIGDIELISEQAAVVRLHVAMAASAITDVNALNGLRARVYRFELQLQKDDRWLLQSAKWSPASVADLE